MIWVSDSHVGPHPFEMHQDISSDCGAVGCATKEILNSSFGVEAAYTCFFKSWAWILQKNIEISVKRSSLLRFLQHLLLIPSQMLPIFGILWHFHFQCQLATSSKRTEELDEVWFEFRCKNDKSSSAFYLVWIAGFSFSVKMFKWRLLHF